jgi:hypothetical protein
MVNGRQFYHELYKIPNIEPWPIVNFTLDFSKSYGKIPNEPLFNIAPEMPIKSENNGADTSFLWKHLENLCGNESQDAKEWIKDWVADIFQHPMEKPGTAVTIRSDERTGKGQFFVVLMKKLLGGRYFTTTKSISSDRFNDWAKNKLLINFNEGSWNNSKSEIGPLKSFITEDDFHFEGKGKDAKAEPNYARAVFTSNATWIMKCDYSERFFMIKPVTKDYCSKEYFDNLAAVIENDDIVKQFFFFF